MFQVATDTALACPHPGCDATRQNAGVLAGHLIAEHRVGAAVALQRARQAIPKVNTPAPVAIAPPTPTVSP